MTTQAVAQKSYRTCAKSKCGDWAAAFRDATLRSQGCTGWPEIMKALQYRPTFAGCRVHRIALTFAASALVGFVPNRVHAQQDALDIKSAEHVRSEYLAELGTIHLKMIALAAAIPADKYVWRPSAGVRSVSEVLMHVASEWYYLIPLSVGEKPHAEVPTGDAMNKLEKNTSKADVLEHLNKSWAHTDSVLSRVEAAKLIGQVGPARMPFARAALRVTGDQHEHLGQLIAYARSIGVKPPWSK